MGIQTLGNAARGLHGDSGGTNVQGCDAYARKRQGGAYLERTYFENSVMKYKPDQRLSVRLHHKDTLSPEDFHTWEAELPSGLRIIRVSRKRCSGDVKQVWLDVTGRDLPEAVYAAWRGDFHSGGFEFVK